MELEQIITLINAGYTKDEIQAFEKPAVPEPEKEPEAPETKEAPAAKEESAPAPAATPGNDQILQALNRLTDAIMKKNLNVTTAQSSSPQTTQDILAKVITPPRKEK